MSDQTSYIGCKISLISKLGIRYDGVLYSVDVNEATIALSNGWSLSMLRFARFSTLVWDGGSTVLETGADSKRGLRVHHLQGQRR